MFLLGRIGRRGACWRLRLYLRRRNDKRGGQHSHIQSDKESRLDPWLDPWRDPRRDPWRDHEIRTLCSLLGSPSSSRTIRPSSTCTTRLANGRIRGSWVTTSTPRDLSLAIS